jgi:transketolase
MGELHFNEMRKVYADVLNELIEDNPDILCLEADLSKASGTNPVVAEKNPANFINIGVAEANMIGVGAGLAIEGKIPFCASFSCFASRRVYDQIYLSVAYANTNVKIVGTAPGITQGPNGGTHMDFQDLAIMRVMPNLHVYSPCDVYELMSMMKNMAATIQPTYMQLVRPKVGKVFDEDFVFEPGKSVVVREGRDVTLVATGYMTWFAVEVADKLKNEGVSVEVLHCGSVKPFDEETLISSAKKTGGVVTVENQSIIGGLGGVVCETLSEKYPVRVKRLGIPDQFGEVATEQYLFDKHKFGPEHIAEACLKMASEK